MLKHTIRLHGPKAKSARVSGTVLSALLELVIDGCQKSLRLRVDGRSAVRGPTPQWLEDAADFEIVALSEGSTVLQMEAPPLWEAAPQRFQQGDFFLEINAERSCFEVFEDSLERALAGDEETDLYDQALLRRFLEFRNSFSKGIDRIELSDHNGVHGRQITVDRRRLDRVENLIEKTPPDQNVRVTGRLDTIRHSDRMFSLVVASGETLRGIAEGIPPAQLAGRWGDEVVVGGRAVFRPSGDVRRIEAHQIEPAQDKDSVWSKMPSPVLGKLDKTALVRTQGPRSGINAIIGQWPGEENEADLAEILQELS